MLTCSPSNCIWTELAAEPSEVRPERNEAAERVEVFSMSVPERFSEALPSVDPAASEPSGPDSTLFHSFGQQTAPGKQRKCEESSSFAQYISLVIDRNGRPIPCSNIITSDHDRAWVVGLAHLVIAACGANPPWRMCKNLCESGRS